ncbi:MAG TPA: cellulose binding domain-containing protein [Actinoplanes sp.]
MKMSKRRLALLIATSLAVPAASFGIATADAAAAPGCKVEYKVTNQWATGFGADVTVTNLGDAVNAWKVGWTLAAGQTISQAWNATVTTAGTAVTAANAGFNGALAAGGTVSFGFNGNWTGSNPVPSAFTLNGTACNVAAATSGATPSAPAPTPCTSPSTPPVTPPTSASGSPTPSTSATPAPTAAPAADQIKIWMAGDSTMMNASACPIGWGSQFLPYFNTDVTLQNSAVGGRSIQTWLYDGVVSSTIGSNGECTLSANTLNARWTAMTNATTGMQAGDYLFVQFGINDGDTTCPRHVGTARFQELLNVMVAAAKARGATPVLVTPVAAITCSGSTAVGNRGFVTETKAVATSAGVPVIDLHTRSIALYNTLKLCPNTGDYTTGAVGAFFCNDHTHFEAAGAAQIAGLVATALKEQNIPLASYLK